MPGWMKQKLESRLQGEISTTSDMQMIPLSWQKAEELKSLDAGKDRRQKEKRVTEDEMVG